MSCNFYVHNDPIGGSKYISGTTCSGTEAFYYLNIGQSVCMDNSKPLINLNGLVISGECFAVTPTPTQTPNGYCWFSSRTESFGTFQCPNDGVLYQDVYGKLTLIAGREGVVVSGHSQLDFIVTNGTEFQTVSILDGQTFTEFIYPKVNFFYTETGCITQNLPDWYVDTFPVTQCPFTPTPTQTPSVTPTLTPTSTFTPTPTQTTTPNPVCPEQITVSRLSTGSTIYDGTYTRLYSWSGGSFNYVYYRQVTQSWIFDTPDDNGDFGVAYGRFDGTNYNTIWAFNSLTNNTINAFGIVQRQDNYQIGLPVSASTLAFNVNELTISNVKYPRAGVSVNNFYISYPAVCPTPTPTRTPTSTQTPTQTSTQTQTPTQTSTLTPTLTPTQTLTPSQTSTQTPTPTLTPSQTPFNFSVLTYTATTACEACCSANTPTTIYSPISGSPSFNVGEFVYTDPQLSVPVPSGTYILNIAFSTQAWAFVGNNGQITETDPNGCLECCGCIQCTPTPTITPTQTPTPSST